MPLKPPSLTSLLRRLLFAATLGFNALAASGPTPATYYVAPNGSDANPGTLGRPFRSLTQARDVIRRRHATRTGDVTVLLRGGTHRVDRTIVFGPEDSGENGHRVIYAAYPGESPVLSGGVAVTGWQREGSTARWQAKAPVANFRQLYVNGRRAVRARGGPLPDVQLRGADGYATSLAAMAGWRNQGEIEFGYFVVWCHTRCKVKQIVRDGNQAIITMLQPWFQIAREKEGVQVEFPSYVENALELLDEPGEWYLDRPRRIVHYQPRRGEDLAHAPVVVPGLETLLELRGSPDRPVHDLTFAGITFAHADWLRPSEQGHTDLQANFIVVPGDNQMRRDGHITMIHNEAVKSPANIVCHAAQRVRFDRCTFTALGGAGLDLECGTQDTVVNGCMFHDLAGSGIQIGGVARDDHHPDDPRKLVRNNRVTNCDIHDVAREYEGGVGIFAGYTQGTLLAHNHIHHLPYSGISIGWGWGEEDVGGGAPNYYQPFKYDRPTPAGGNRVAANHIHHTMLRRDDGGAIYTLGNQPGTVIQENYLHDSVGRPGGIYLDEGSGFIEVTGNVVHGVATPMNYNNRAQDRIATCREHDNFFNTTNRAVIDRAGPAPAYNSRMR